MFYLLAVSLSVIYIVDILKVNLDYCDPTDVLCRDSFNFSYGLSLLILAGFTIYCVIRGAFYEREEVIQNLAQLLF